MEIFNEKTFDLKQHISLHAKYQKVMVLYDISSSDERLVKIKEQLQEDCIFNCIHIFDKNINEIFDGYKMLIFLCSSESFLHLNIDLSEFECVFFPTTKYILPFFCDENCNVSRNNKTIVVNSKITDPTISCSICFNLFCKKFYNTINPMFDDFVPSFDPFVAPTFSHASGLENLDNCELVDLSLAKTQHLELSILPLIDLILIDGFVTLITSIKNKKIVMVDSFKICKNDIDMVDKIYKYASDRSFFELINLNFNYLYGELNKTKNNILSFLDTDNLNNEQISETIESVKNYCQNADSIFTYLFVYDIFI